MMMTVRRFAVFSAFFVSLVWSAAAAAQPQRLVNTDGSLECVYLNECDPSAPACAEGEDCTQIGSFDLYWCNRGQDGFFCCGGSGPGGADSKCDIHDGVVGDLDAEGECRMFEGDDQIGGVEGVCQFKGDTPTDDPGYAPTFCENDPAISPEQFLIQCMTTPEGNPTDDWHQGDCDGDTWKNSIDFGNRCGSCDPMNYPTDDRSGECVVPVLPPADAGPDTGPRRDTGTGATPGSPPGPNFRGAGGCACESAAAPFDAPAAPALFVIALFLFRSTRRAGRGS